MFSTKKILHTTFILALSLASAAATADDTEVYLGNNLASTVQPNLIFIIDTSGSMSTDVTLTTGSYDPSQTYTGSCDSNKVYYSRWGGPPSCGTSYYVDKSSFVCKAGQQALDSSGFFTNRAGRYRSGGWWSSYDYWSTLSSWNHSDLVECKADWGVHGKTDTSTNLYPANSNNDDNSDPGYRNDTNGAINWDSTGDSYTFYSANYLNWRNAPGTTTTKTRLEIVKEVFADLMNSISGINVAVMRYDNDWSSRGGYFVMPMQALTDTNRQDYIDAVNLFSPGGNTPLAETLYESYLFYKGDTVKFGNSTSPDTNVSGVLDPSNTDRYLSPIEYSCQKNFVILLTDGEPTGDTDADYAIEHMPGFSTVTGSNYCSGNCLDELADYMHTKDCSSLPDTQNVITYTIGFATDQTLLNDTATKGGGKYYTADDTAGLTDAFTEILTDILAINTTFIAPAVSVNAFNRFTHRDELYYALFKPNERPNWNGNVKKFKLSLISGQSTPIIVDANDDPAIDQNTGFFKTTATSFWTLASEAPDGDKVAMGGAASKQTLPRSVYTYTGSAAPSDVALTDTANALTETNAAITKTMLGDATMTDSLRTAVLQWAKGVDLLDEDSDGDTTDARRHMGDPLHSKPVLITYGGTDANPDMTLYAATNEGYLHAIDTSDGTETFAFMPQALLSNLPILFDNTSSSTHPYGLDGPLTTWFNDKNGNGILYDATNTLEAGEFVYLYQGMRRGGKNYYALDVTDRSNPTLKWVIKGGTGDFSELSQTWSSATKAKIKLNGVSKDVLIFGGGYDPSQDTINNPSNDGTGRAIFIVDAETGAELWQAGPAGTGDDTGADPDLVLSDMTNSIPSDLRVIDVDGDGYADRIYVGDTRAQLWRFDIDNNGNTGASDLATGAVIAQLGGNAPEDNRRFYYAPDVSLSADDSYLNIAIGSGYRAHPLDTVIHDAFYVLHDYDVYNPPADNNGDNQPDYTTLTMSDLFDATDNIIGQGTTSQVSTAKSALSNSDGWYIWLMEDPTDTSTFIGEKVLAKSITIEGEVMFTTYTPVASAAGSCSPSQGTARAYFVNVNDATPYVDTDNSGGDFTRPDRHYDLVRGGIPPEVSILFNKDGVVALIGTEEGPPPDLTLAPRKIYWLQD